MIEQSLKKVSKLHQKLKLYGDLKRLKVVHYVTLRYGVTKRKFVGITENGFISN